MGAVIQSVFIIPHHPLFEKQIIHEFSIFLPCAERKFSVYGWDILG
jgi:hypothetical protein